MRVLPVTEWYHFKPRIQIRNAEAAERQNALNRAKLEERVRRVTKKLDGTSAHAHTHSEDMDSLSGLRQRMHRSRRSMTTMT